MENYIETLFNTIKERSHKWMEYKEMFGDHHILTESVFNSLTGLEEAFQMAAGHSYTTHLIAFCKAQTEHIVNSCNALR